MPKAGDIIRAEDFKTNGGFIGQIIEFPSNLIPSNALLGVYIHIPEKIIKNIFV